MNNKSCFLAVLSDFHDITGEGDTVQDKMIELQTKFAFQEDLLSSLNDEVVHQQRQIAELVREVALMKSQMVELMARDTKAEAAESAHEVPPHY